MKLDVRLLLAIGLGGAIGSIARYILNVFIQSRTLGTFPVGIMTINIAGSLLLGFLMRLGLETSAMSPEVRVFLTAGFCGGFTTFSTFSYDALLMVETGNYRGALGYVAGSVLLSCLAALLGVSAAHHLGALLRPRVA